jgi:hypothetical protein
VFRLFSCLFEIPGIDHELHVFHCPFFGVWNMPKK